MSTLKKFKEPIYREPTRLEKEGVKNIMNRKGWVLNEDGYFHSLNNDGFLISLNDIKVIQEFNPISEIARLTNKVEK